MKKPKTKKFSSSQKIKIILEVIKEVSTIAEISEKHDVTTKTIQRWKKEFIEKAPTIFENDQSGKIAKEKISDLTRENDALAKALGRATIERDFLVGKLASLDLNNRKSLFESKLKKISKSRQCELLSISRSSMSYNKKTYSKSEIALMHKIDKICTDNPEYGYRFVYHQLREEGYFIGRDRTLKYMRAIGIETCYPRKKRKSSNNKSHEKYKYLLDDYKTNNDKNSVIVENANEVWSGDITYLPTKHGFVYMAAIIDWYSKAILSYKISNIMDELLVSEVLLAALEKYPAPAIFNSDQGSQYTSKKHTDILRENNIKISMNGKGRSIDNIIIERFFRTLKSGYIYLNKFETVMDLKGGVNEYIEKYNFKRFHSSLAYQKPMDVYLFFMHNLACR